MKFKVFIDGESGTTGLRIKERLNRDDIELLQIPYEKRHDEEEIKKYINESDVTFLCLPDDVSDVHYKFKTNPNTILIDAATVHRCDEMFAYGFPELSEEFLNKIKNSKYIAVPGCYASGFNSIVYPLVKLGVAACDYPFAANAISGYSGAGKKGIAQYEDKERSVEFDAPRLYAMSEAHKHMKEMMFIPGLKEKPLFVPYVCDFYEGMIVNIPLYVSKLNKKVTPKELHDMFEQYYKGSAFVKVMHFNEKGNEDGFFSANSIAGKDYLCIYVSGNDERILLTALLDNLGKGASGAAIECMNIALGLDSTKGLNL